MATEPQHSEITSGAATSSEAAGQPPEQRDIGGEAAVILAALGRMEAAVREDRAALRQLRASLLDMAQAIAGAKHVADSEAATAMLDEFEHRVDAMIEIAGGRAAEAQQEAAESDQVPTVSGVVSQFGPAEPSAAEAPQPAEATGEQSPATASSTVASPTVAMLTAMVEALSAAIQAPAQEAPAAETPAPPPSDPEPVAEVAAVEPPPPGDPEIETALLASFVQMEARPFPPPDEGTAVIFTRPEPESAREPEPEPAEAWTEAPPPPEPQVTAKPEQPIAVAAEPEQSAAPEIAETLPAAAPEPVPPARAAAVPPEAEFDPSDFLFGPEPEPDPAAFLLDPAPPQRKAVLPQAEFVTVPPREHPPQKTSATAEAPTAETDPPAPPEAAPESQADDPLRALKAMTENERLAIFS